jgi:hypothetical protein
MNRIPGIYRDSEKCGSPQSCTEWAFFMITGSFPIPLYDYSFISMRGVPVKMGQGTLYQLYE